MQPHAEGLALGKDFRHKENISDGISSSSMSLGVCDLQMKKPTAKIPYISGCCPMFISDKCYR